MKGGFITTYFKRGNLGFDDVPLPLEQAQRLNEILRAYRLTEMSMSFPTSHLLWFAAGQPICRKLNHLSRQEIFALDKELKGTVFTVNYIIDGSTKTIEIAISY